MAGSNRGNSVSIQVETANGSKDLQVRCDDTGDGQTGTLTIGGTATAAAAISASDNAIKSGAGRFYGVNVTTAGTGATLIKDGSTTICTVVANPTLGYQPNIPAGGVPFSSNLTVTGNANNSAVTLVYT